jgi:hypothetical protein
MGTRAGRLGIVIMSKQAMMLAVMLAGALACWAQNTSGKHTITVKFTYDFRKTAACTEKVRKKCVAQFNLYDLSAGYKNRTKLFSVPVGTVTEAGVKEYTGTSPLILFESGKHLIGMAAQTAENVESDPRACTTWVEIP